MNVKALSAFMSVIGLFLSQTALGAENVSKGDLSLQIRHLISLDGEEYRTYRDEILQLPDIVNALQTLLDETDSRTISLVCKALIYRCQDPEASQLLSRYWCQPGTEGAWAGSPLLELRGNLTYAPIVIACFGAEAYPIIAENVLYSWDDESRRITALDALVQMRCACITDILLYLVERGEESLRVRASAVWNMGMCLRGLPAERTKYYVIRDSHIRAPGAFRPVPEELADRPQARELPALNLEDEDRQAIIGGLAAILSDAPEEVLRALAAQALGYSDRSGVDPLTQAIMRDPSTGVRSWCAASLRSIGGHQAMKALNNVERGQAEYLRVIKGEEMPVDPCLRISPADAAVLDYQDSHPGRHHLPSKEASPSPEAIYEGLSTGTLSMTAEDIIAVKGDPIIANLTLTYSGAKRTKAYRAYHQWEKAITITAPEGWAPGNAPNTIPIGVEYTAESETILVPGEQLEITCDLGSRYTQVPLGRSSLTLTMPINPVEGEMIYVSTEVSVLIIPADYPATGTESNETQDGTRPSWPTIAGAVVVGMVIGLGLGAFYFRRQKS